jgi:hypothetical protein
MYPTFDKMTEEDWTKARGELELFLLRISTHMSQEYVSHLNWLATNTAKFVRFFNAMRARDPLRLYGIWMLSRERHPDKDEVKRFYKHWTEYPTQDQLVT